MSLLTSKKSAAVKLINSFSLVYGTASPGGCLHYCEVGHVVFQSHMTGQKSHLTPKHRGLRKRWYGRLDKVKVTVEGEYFLN